jgi:uncharacterized metal-binding protein YceD (DUF177 family)
MTMKFRISEIPEGHSERTLELNDSTLPFSKFSHKNGEIKITFEKRHGLIRVFYVLTTTLELICDRSLDGFDHPVNAEYEIVFKSGVEESEDEKGAIRALNISGNIISIENEVRDSIFLSIPIKKIHPRFIDNNGKISEFNAVYSDNDETTEELADERWQALKKLKVNQNN